MLIGELADRSGLSRDTIRFYEKHGLVSVTRRERRENNYKEYSEEVLRRLLTIKRIKTYGFTLREISEILELIDLNEATCDTMEIKASEKIARLNKQIKALVLAKSMLMDGIQQCKSDRCVSTGPEPTCTMFEELCSK